MRVWSASFCIEAVYRAARVCYTGRSFGVWVTRRRQYFGEARKSQSVVNPAPVLDDRFCLSKLELESPRVLTKVGTRLRFDPATDRIVGMKEGKSLSGVMCAQPRSNGVFLCPVGQFRIALYE